MFTNTSKNIFKAMVQNGFEPIKSEPIAEELTEDSQFVGLIKLHAKCWYTFFIVNTNAMPFEEFRQFQARITIYCQTLQKEYNIKNIFAVVLFVLGGDDQYTSFLNEEHEFFLDDITQIYWAIEPENNELIAAKNHPSEILDFRRIISDAAIAPQNDNIVEQDTSSSDLSELYQTAVKENPYLSVKSSKAMVTYLLIIINMVVFVVMELNGGTNNTSNLIAFGAIVPGLIYQGEYYRLFTAIFIHIGLTHLVYNCFSLWIFGTRVEKYYGSIRYLLLYLISGLTGSVFSLFLTRSVAAGASGAIFGCVGAVAALAKKSNRDVDKLNYSAMTVYIAVSLGSGFFKGEVDNFAHLGGLLAGAALGFIFCNTFNKKAKERKF